MNGIVLVNKVRFDGRVVRIFITIRLFKSLATTSNCMSQICGLWLNNATALRLRVICLSVAIQFTQNFLGVEPDAVRSASSSRIFARSCSVSAPPELKCRASWFKFRPPCCTGRAGWKRRSGFLLRRQQRQQCARSLQLCSARRIKVERERFRSLQVSSSDVFSSAVTRNLMTCVLLFGVSWYWGIARNRLNIRFGHCTSCLFDNSSVKLCKARHAVPFVPLGTNDEQGWGRHAPTRITSECRRIVEVKSRMDRTFSRIENLWPRDGSCPLPLRSKSFPGNCFRIVKA